MRNRIALKLAALMLAGTCISAFASTEEQIHKQFPANPGGTLVVDVDFGGIEISTNSAGEVAIDVYRKITRRKKADEEAYLKDRPVKFSSEDGTVRVESKGKVRETWTWGRKRSNEAKYTISVPSHFNVRLRTSGGGIRIKALAGNVDAATGGGGLEFQNVQGTIDAQTSGGGIHLNNCDGEIGIRTSGGGLEIVGGSGALEGKTSGGGITVEDFEGPVRVSTSGGHIRIKDAAAALEASTSGGSIEASLKSVADAVSLTTSGGHVSVGVPPDAAFELDARTSGGHVSCELPITIVGKLEHDKLSGKVNGGGQKIYLRTSGGSIEVKKR